MRFGLTSNVGSSRDVQVPDQGYVFSDRSPQVSVTCLFLVKSDFWLDTSDSFYLMIQFLVDPEFE